jgi:ketosteroid isomerase-like protein
MPSNWHTLDRMSTTLSKDTGTAQIASRLTEFCRLMDWTGAHKALFAADAVSIEPEGAGPQTTTRGVENFAKKAQHFGQEFEQHSCVVSDPIVAGDFFACTIAIDVTERKSGARFTLTEVAVYEVKDGKIAREQFFYRPPAE